jgi:hypothetical protein
MIFHPKEIDRVITYVTKLFERGRSVNIEFITRTKSLSQVAYCWLCFTIIGQDTGNTKDDIYQLCLKKFPVFKTIELNGVLTMIPLTMSGFDKEQMSHFIDEFTTYFRSEGFDIPDPEDKKAVEMFQFYKERGLI